MVILMLNPRINRRNDEEFPYIVIAQSPTEVNILFRRMKSLWHYGMHERWPQTNLLESAYEAFDDSLEQRYSPLLEKLIKQGDNTSKQEDNSLERVNNPTERAENPLEQVYSPSEQAYNEIHSSMREIAPTSEQGGTHNMEEGYKRLLDRLDQDIRDHRKEIAERDARLQAEMREREARLHAEMREREERIIKVLEESLAGQKEVLDLKMGAIETRINHINEEIGHLRSEMSALTQRVDNVHSRVDQLKYFIIGSLITMLVAIVGSSYALIQIVIDLIGNK